MNGEISTHPSIKSNRFVLFCLVVVLFFRSPLKGVYRAHVFIASPKLPHYQAHDNGVYPAPTSWPSSVVGALMGSLGPLLSHSPSRMNPLGQTNGWLKAIWSNAIHTGNQRRIYRIGKIYVEAGALLPRERERVTDAGQRVWGSILQLLPPSAFYLRGATRLTMDANWTKKIRSQHRFHVLLAPESLWHFTRLERKTSERSWSFLAGWGFRSLELHGSFSPSSFADGGHEEGRTKQPSPFATAHSSLWLTTMESAAFLRGPL